MHHRLIIILRARKHKYNSIRRCPIYLFLCIGYFNAYESNLHILSIWMTYTFHTFDACFLMFYMHNAWAHAWWSPTRTPIKLYLSIVCIKKNDLFYLSCAFTAQCTYSTSPSTCHPSMTLLSRPLSIIRKRHLWTTSSIAVMHHHALLTFPSFSFCPQMHLFVCRLFFLQL